MPIAKTNRHGTVGGYTNHGCRCGECRAAMSEYLRRRRCGLSEPVDREALKDLLHELFPDGLTDDCPARRRKAVA
jgi:cytidine deaminase